MASTGAKLFLLLKYAASICNVFGLIHAWLLIFCVKCFQRHLVEVFCLSSVGCCADLARKIPMQSRNSCWLTSSFPLGSPVSLLPTTLLNGIILLFVWTHYTSIHCRYKDIKRSTSKSTLRALCNQACSHSGDSLSTCWILFCRLPWLHPWSCVTQSVIMIFNGWH